MTNATINIALAQPLVVPGNIDLNIRRTIDMTHIAADRDADAVLFSECGLTGYDHAGIGVRAAIEAGDPRLEDLAKLAKDRRIAVIVGFYQRTDTGLFNSAMCLMPDGTRVLQHKHRIIDWEAANTKTRSGPRRRVVFDLHGIKSAMLICADNGMEAIGPELAEQGVKLVFSLTAGCGETSMGFSLEQVQGDPQARSRWLARQHQVAFPDGSVRFCMEHDMALAACNQAGYVPDLGYFHPGHSSVVAPDGRVAALIPGQFVFQHLRPEIVVGRLEF